MSKRKRGGADVLRSSMSIKCISFFPFCLLLNFHSTHPSPKKALCKDLNYDEFTYHTKSRLGSSVNEPETKNRWVKGNDLSTVGTYSGCQRKWVGLIGVSTRKIMKENRLLWTQGPLCFKYISFTLHLLRAEITGHTSLYPIIGMLWAFNW